MEVLTNIDNISVSEWHDFVYSHPEGNIFQTHEMYLVYQSSTNFIPYIFICISHNTILGVMLAVVQKESTGILGFFTARSIISGGPLITGHNEEVLKLLIDAYNLIIRKRVIYTQIRNFVLQSWQKEVFESKGFLFDDHLNIKLNIAIDNDLLWNGFSRSRKKGIRKAMKAEFVFKASQQMNTLQEFYSLLCDSYKRIKLPYPSIQHFIELKDGLSSQNFYMLSLYLGEKNVVSMFCLIYKQTMFGYYIGATGDIKITNLKPSDLFFWEVFKWAKSKGIKSFDWMGAGKPNKAYGVRDFKLQFGGELENLGRYEKFHYPILYKLGLIGIRIYQKLKR